jgi:Icc-related predicted phosphoesterase
LDCLFISDLHGNIKKFLKLFEIIRKNRPDAVFLGGDLLPRSFEMETTMEEFLEIIFFSEFEKIKNEFKNDIRFFTILGNDDPRIFEKNFIDASKSGTIDYVHNKTEKFGEFFVTGYSFVPPTPFQLKDWEKYDVSRFVDVGAVSPEDGFRTVDIDKDKVKYSTISEDLKELSKNSPIEKTIFLFHSPPYNSNLDRSSLDNEMVDHAPLDVHLGSIAIKRFIEKKQPMLTLHGHIHESVKLTGIWKEKNGYTYSFSAAHDGPELALIKFNTSNLDKARRYLINIS